jgi:hypothetical protein
VIKKEGWLSKKGGVVKNWKTRHNYRQTIGRMKVSFADLGGQP